MLGFTIALFQNEVSQRSGSHSSTCTQLNPILEPQFSRVMDWKSFPVFALTREPVDCGPFTADVVAWRLAETCLYTALKPAASRPQVRTEVLDALYRHAEAAIAVVVIADWDEDQPAAVR